jgi:hypothetical protein
MRAIKKILVFALIVIADLNFAQLTGTAFLASQSNHSGVKVKFKANPGTAVTDSTLTDANGNYSINITSGSYNIIYSNTGYLTAYYANNTAQILTNTVVLNPVTLMSGNTVTISGNVTGTLVNTNIYIVNGGAITVPTGSTLVIPPGTQIRFNQNYPFNVYGTLIAQGSPGNEIVFTSNKNNPTSNDWAGIEIHSSSTKVTNCIIEYADHCIMTYGCGPMIEYNDIRKFATNGILLTNGFGTARYNKVHDFLSGNSSGSAILAQSQADGSNPPIVECNEVYNGTYGIHGISTGIKAIVRNNYVHNLEAVGLFQNWGMDSSIFMNNLIKACACGIVAKEKALILNNTIYSCTTGIAIDNGGGKGIINNVVVNNYNGIYQGNSSASPSVITHNLVWNNTNNYKDVTLVGIGQNLSTNGNGDPIDAYYNFSVDPNFVGGIPPYLNSSSHCYNAGNAQYSPNVGCNTNLICSNIALGIGEFKNDLKFAVFPNPFSDDVTVKVQAIDPSFAMKDVLGKNVNLNVNGISNGEFRVNTVGINSGVYFLTVTDGNSVKTIKLIKN